MGDCGLNCDFNAGVIDLWERQTHQERAIAKKKDKNYQQMMDPIRKSHVCSVCRKYPEIKTIFSAVEMAGDFKCFECL